MVCYLKTHSTWVPVREQFLYLNPAPFLYSLILIIDAVTVSDLIVVSSKFFLFLLMIPFVLLTGRGSGEGIGL